MVQGRTTSVLATKFLGAQDSLPCVRSKDLVWSYKKTIAAQIAVKIFPAIHSSLLWLRLQTSRPMLSHVLCQQHPWLVYLEKRWHQVEGKAERCSMYFSAMYCLHKQSCSTCTPHFGNLFVSLSRILNSKNGSNMSLGTWNMWKSLKCWLVLQIHQILV